MADMAADGRRPARPLIEDLFDSPHGYELIQAIALLERATPDRVPLGAGFDPEHESVRIEQDPTMAFPASDVTAMRRDHAGQAVLRTAAFSLAGVSGPLPYALTEVLLERGFRRDKSMAGFLDLFNHRLVSIFYRIRRAVHPLLEGDPHHAAIALALRSFIGIGQDTLTSRNPQLPDRALLGFTGILADRRGSAAALQTVIAGTFGAPTEIIGFNGGWLPLPESAHTRLSRTSDPEVRRLGGGAVLGERVWDQHAAFVVRVRLTSLGHFQDFLPVGGHYRPLMSLCRFHVGLTMTVALELILDAAAVPPLRISVTNGARLGWTSWLLGPAGRTQQAGRVRLVKNLAGD